MDKSLEKSLLVWLKAQKKACGLFLKLSLWLGMISAVAMVAQSLYYRDDSGWRDHGTASRTAN